MTVSKKQLKKAIHRLKMDGKTPVEVINFISDKILINETNKEHINSNEVENPFKSDSLLRFDTSKLGGLMNNVYFNTGNGLLIKKTFNILCSNFKNLTNRSFPLTYEETNEVITLIKNKCILDAIKLFKNTSMYGLRESKDIIDGIRKNI